MNIQEIADFFGYISWDSTPFQGVAIDSRTLQPGQIFCALRGPRFDGHDFLEEASARGAIAAIVETPCPTPIPQWQVADSEKALTALAALYRKTFTFPVIALTGSNGKTSVKEMIAAILPPPRFATVGNLNNHLGVPLSILQMKPTHKFAVFELGANHLGEIAHTASLVQPEVALINNIAPAHIEEFGSIENIARAKGEIYQALSKDGMAVINEDDAYAHFWDAYLQERRCIRFSRKKVTEVYAKQIDLDDSNCASFILVLPEVEAPVRLQVPGMHAVSNALAAASSCYAIGISLETIVRGLERFTGVQGRMTYLVGKNQSRVIDDTYNANLQSVLTAVVVLSKQPGTRILVLGDMGELGEYAASHHEAIGHKALEAGIDIVMTYGSHSVFTSRAFGNKAKHYQDQTLLAQELVPLLNGKTTVLVKGSRLAAMEKVVHVLVNA